MQGKYILFIAALLGAFGVMLGAFGAHGLKGTISEAKMDVFQTAFKYQMIHVLAVFAAVILYKMNGENGIFYTSAWFFIAGIVLFSGSLYLLAAKELLGIENWRWLGPVTPLGGLSFITGWLLLAWGILKMKWH